ncbi:TonB-dependent receptor [Haoranjiania flava]|uniref:TonB-dependent receptor n=1 Tax=Haoranjiania flava TaxID=1856322 RepID=A0AAE3LMI9_9BACT|nr:TonB-dependent receptor [Haoranjiania flava]MCU7693926.1 TonB-dependent receptor [Haoranjiania flava]
MKASLLTIFLLVSGSALMAQADLLTDTIPRTDSMIADIKSQAIDNLPTITINDDDLEDGSLGTVSSILTAGRDPFLSAVSYNFSPARFRLRSYENGDAVYLNGIDFTGLDNGFTPYGLWSGLTNVMRSRENAYGLAAGDFAIGSLGLNTNIDMRAGAQWAQTQIGYAVSNRNYTHRILLTHGSGFNKKGWAYSFMLSPRYANEGYIPGSYYRSLSYYAAVDKLIGTKNTFSLIAFGTPTENGRQSPSTQEAMDLAGTNYYNPAWGFQNGKKRNANVAETFQPAFMAVHEYKPTNKSSLMTSVAYVFGKRKTSGIDWFNAPDPRPDYYRNLPSYYDLTEPNKANILRDYFKNNPDALQINWHSLYDVNYGNIETVNNINGNAGNTLTGKRSLYILSNRVNDLKRIMANTVYKTQLNDKVTLTAGANFQNQVNAYYQEVKDLLGGDFLVNINQFAQRAFPLERDKWQHDVNTPNRIVKTGEKYGYDYTMTMNRAAAWAQGIIVLDNFDFFAGGEISRSNFYRTGLNKNGLFLEQSYGDSKKLNFTNVSAKAGVTYKYNGRNYFFLNGGYFTAPPFFENVFIAPRTQNTMQDSVQSEIFKTVEGGYRLVTPRVKATLTAYYTQSKNGYDVRSFYYDGGDVIERQDFINYSLSGIDKLFFGTEIGLEVKLTQTLTFNGAAFAGRAYYDSRQKAIISIDNSGQKFAPQTIYLKDYRIPSTPQNAYSAGFFYRSPKYWYVSLTANYFDNMWVDPAPSKRAKEIFQNLDITDPKVNDFYTSTIKQEKYEPQFTLDFFGGWSKRLSRKYYFNNQPSYLVFNLGVNNILNNTNIRSGGFEQARFDNNPQTLNANKFPSKYYYAYGINYYASVIFRFN